MERAPPPQFVSVARDEHPLVALPMTIATVTVMAMAMIAILTLTDAQV